MDKKTVLVYAFTHLNLGDDLFLKILIERYPDTDFVLIADENKYQEIFPGSNISFFRFPKTFIDRPLVRKLLSKFVFRLFVTLKYQINKNYLRRKKSCYDAVVTIGGSLFIQPRNKHQFKKNIHFVIDEVFPDKPKFILGANFGPYSDDAYLNLYHELFQKYTDISFRDQYSKSLFSDLKQVRCSSDIVFSLKTDNIRKIEKTVGFSLIDLSSRGELSKYKEIYESEMFELIKQFCKKGYTVYLFSFCKGEGDEKVINNIKNKIAADLLPDIKTVFYTGDLSSFVTLFQSMEIVFATRFHAMILSLISKQKTVPIIYSKKMKNVLDDISFPNHFFEIETLESIKNKDFYKNIHTDVLPFGIRQEAERHFDKLDVFLNYKSQLQENEQD